MTWTWCHNAGQTLTYLKTLPKDMTVWSLLSPSDPLWLQMCCFWFCYHLSALTIGRWHIYAGSFSCFSDFPISHFPSFCTGAFVSGSLRLRDCQQRFLVRFVCLPCNSLQRAAGPAREPLSYWFNDSSSYFAGICMSVLLSTLSTHAQWHNKKYGYGGSV